MTLFVVLLKCFEESQMCPESGLSEFCRGRKDLTLCSSIGLK